MGLPATRGVTGVGWVKGPEKSVGERRWFRGEG